MKQSINKTLGITCLVALIFIVTVYCLSIKLKFLPGVSYSFEYRKCVILNSLICFSFLLLSVWQIQEMCEFEFFLFASVSYYSLFGRYKCKQEEHS